MPYNENNRLLTVDVSRLGDPQSFVIGRAGKDGVDFGIDDDFVSNRHVKVTRNSMGVVLIEDLGSTNGSYFNGSKLGFTKMVVNKPGGILHIGHTDVEIKLVDDWLSRVTSDTVPEPND